MSCHGTRGDADRQVGRGRLAPNSVVDLLTNTLALPYSHPLTEAATSRREPGAVTCSSCHSPHRNPGQTTETELDRGRRKVSSRDSTRFEFELCQSCHGNKGIYTQDLNDISRLTEPTNISFHPIEAAAQERSQSVDSELSGQEINCTDCHNSSDRTGPRGPHASEFPYILGERYTTTDGSSDSPQAYALCYRCHDRERLMESSSFGGHRLHVQEIKTSCATCHNPHGSVENRALIRYGEETNLAGVSPAIQSGRLAFESMAPGIGACWVSCHGTSHDPATYGVDAMFFDVPTAVEGFPDALFPPQDPFGPTDLAAPTLLGPKKKQRPPD